MPALARRKGGVGTSEPVVSWLQRYPVVVFSVLAYAWTLFLGGPLGEEIGWRGRCS